MSDKRAGRGRPNKMSDATTLKQLGISRDQASRWMRLASVDKDTFEAALGDKSQKASTEGILRRANMKPKARAEPKTCPHCGGSL